MNFSPQIFFPFFLQIFFIMKNSRVLFKVVFHSVKINIERQVVFFQEKKRGKFFKKNDDDFFRKQNIPDFAHDQVAFEVFSHFGWIFLMLKFCSTFKQHLAQIFLSRFFFLCSALSHSDT